MGIINTTSVQKEEYARKLLQANIPYRDIQEHLKVRFGSGMSNTTLKKLAEKTDEVAKLQKKLEKTEQELKLYKQLYFDLIKSLKQNLS